MNRRSRRSPMAAGMLLGLLTGCAYDLSFKGVTFEQVDYPRLFQTCKDVVVEEYAGRIVLADVGEGRIESDPVQFNVPDGTRREQVFVHLDRLDGGAVLVELLAPIYEMRLDPDSDTPVRWVPLGSDVKQENRLLDRILGETLLDQPQVRVRDPR